MSRLLLEPVPPAWTAADAPANGPVQAAPSRRPPSAGGAATSFPLCDQATALALLRSEQMPIADYLALCDEIGWDRMWGIAR